MIPLWLNHFLSTVRQPPKILSSILKMPGRAGYFSVYFFATVGLTGRHPYWPKGSWATGPLVKRMDLFARSLLALFLSTAIGSSISIVWRGITYWMSVPAAREVSA